MGANRLVVNLGSSSVRYGLFKGERELARVHLEQAESPPGSLDHWLAQLSSERILQSRQEIASVVIRVVAPSRRFANHQVIDETFVDDLRSVLVTVSNHGQAVLAEIKQIRELLPEAELIAASDSAFHTTLPERARRYAIPESIAAGRDLYRVGYHGLSLASVIRQLTSELGSVPHRTVICHLGAGVSVTALLDGTSVDTSMGYTPLEGIPMRTRVGDLDPGVLLALLTESKDFHRHLGGEQPVSSEVRENITDVTELRRILTEESGLAALSGSTGDMKELLARRGQGDKAAAFAIDVFCYKVRKSVGASAAALGGLDALFLTGTIAERSKQIVQEIGAPLAWLGVTAEVIPTDELGELARITL